MRLAGRERVDEDRIGGAKAARPGPTTAREVARRRRVDGGPVGPTVVLAAFAHAEEDGILLAIAPAVALGLFAAATVALWNAVAAPVRSTG